MKHIFVIFIENSILAQMLINSQMEKYTIEFALNRDFHLRLVKNGMSITTGMKKRWYPPMTIPTPSKSTMLWISMQNMKLGKYWDPVSTSLSLKMMNALRLLRYVFARWVPILSIRIS